MVEKVKALCNAIDTLNSLPTNENTDARLAELSEMLLAECKQMVTPLLTSAEAVHVNKWKPKGQTHTAGNDIEEGDFVTIKDGKVFSTAARPTKPEPNEGFHTLLPTTPVPLKEFYSTRPYDKDIDNPLPPQPPTKESIEQRRQDIARATLLREMGEINGDVPSGQKIYAPVSRPAQAEPAMGYPERAPSPPTTYQKNHPDLGLPRLP
jgi:hypothetical protein